MSLLNSLFYDAKKEERQKTIALYDSAKSLYDLSALPHHLEHLSELAIELTCDVFFEKERSVKCAIFDTLRAFVEQLFLTSNLYYFLDSAARDSFDDDLEYASHTRETLRDKKTLFRNSVKNHETVCLVAQLFIEDIISNLPSGAFSEHKQNAQVFNVSILEFLDAPHTVIKEILSTFFVDDVVDTPLFRSLRIQLNQNIDRASGITSPSSTKPVLLPTDFIGKKSISEVAQLYLGGTFLHEIFTLTVPFTIPYRARFEHMHIVGGSGHGKTQCMQHIIYDDIMRAVEGKGGLCVIDSQGDLINNIMRLAEFSPTHEKSLADKVLLLDPNDIEYPLSLNMFDMHLERIKQFSKVEQEKILNGTIELYEYIFSALLGAELTQRQGVIFKYLARAMMAIPGATIQTLREFVEDGSQFRPHIAKTGEMTRHFFDTQFFTPTYKQTRQQILTRLWGILSNPVFERMFSAPKNNVDLFGAMNAGKIVMINTAKDLLKSDGCSIFGRFFVAMIAQAALSRSAIALQKRTPFFVYIDEMQDYFSDDNKIEDLLNQARKYKVGLILAHQNLDQISTKLRASILASTSIKMVGGVSAKDANIFAKNMHCDEAFILSAKKRTKHTEFACYVRNVTAQPVKLSVPLGMLESKPTISQDDFKALIASNRQRVCSASFDAVSDDPPVVVSSDNSQQEPTELATQPSSSQASSFQAESSQVAAQDDCDTQEAGAPPDEDDTDDEPLIKKDRFVVKRRAVRNRSTNT